jgi:hypothetical protein
MIKKALTYFTILAITALPVQLVSASAENVSMQMSMSQQMLANNECLHEMATKNLNSETEQNSKMNTCCDDQSSSCQGCNDVTHATSVMTSPVITSLKTSLLSSTKLFANNSLLHGIPQKNFLRPPRTHI